MASIKRVVRRAAGFGVVAALAVIYVTNFIRLQQSMHAKARHHPTVVVLQSPDEATNNSNNTATLQNDQAQRAALRSTLFHLSRAYDVHIPQNQLAIKDQRPGLETIIGANGTVVGDAQWLLDVAIIGFVSNTTFNNKHMTWNVDCDLCARALSFTSSLRANAERLH
jgi:hypothetical protein